MRKSTNLALGVFFLMLGVETSAYETSTHKMLAANAVTRSVLMKPNDTLLADLGFQPWDSATYFNSNGAVMGSAELIEFGAVEEDDNYQKRSFNHFFDPQFNRPAGRGLDVLLIFHGLPSPDWAIEDRGSSRP